MAIFWVGIITLLAVTAIFYIVLFSFIYYWHLVKITYLVVPAVFTFEFFVIGFFIVAITHYFILRNFQGHHRGFVGNNPLARNKYQDISCAQINSDFSYQHNTDSKLRMKFESTKIVFESVLRKRTFEKFVDLSMFRCFASVIYIFKTSLIFFATSSSL